jgi:hypothetical protein
VKIFQIDDDKVELMEGFLRTISRKEEVDSLVYCVVFDDQKYGVGYWNANPANMITASGYIAMDANMRYMKINRAEFEEDDEEEA